MDLVNLRGIRKFINDRLIIFNGRIRISILQIILGQPQKGFKFCIGFRIFINDQLEPFDCFAVLPQFKLAFGNADIGILGNINIIGIKPQDFLKIFQASSGSFKFK